MWRCEIKEHTPQMTFLHCGRTVRSSHRRSSIKKAVLKNLAMFIGKHLCWGLFLIKRESNTGVSCRRLFFDCFDGLHPKGSRSRLYQSPNPRTSFLFLSRHLSSRTESPPAVTNLSQIPLMSQLSFYIG